MPRVPSTLVVCLLLVTSGAQTAFAQSGSQLLLRPFRQTDQLELDADAAFGFRSDLQSEASDDPFDLRLDVYDITGRVRLTPGLSDRGIARAQPRFGFSTRYLQLHTADPSLPDEMFDGSAAIGMGVLASQGWLGGLTLGAGYAGADFESDANALYFQGSFAIGKTFESGDAFGIVLDYNGNRTFLPDWPLAGFQYRKRFPPQEPAPPEMEAQGRRQGALEGYNPDTDPARLVLAIGFPYSGIEWRPTDRLRVEAVYAIPQSINARADYTLLGDPAVSGLGIYANLSRTVTAVHWNDLPDRDRLFFRQSLAEAGINWRLNDRLELVIAGGWSFGQEFVTGWDTRDTDDVANVDDAPYFRALARLRL